VIEDRRPSPLPGRRPSSDRCSRSRKGHIKTSPRLCDRNCSSLTGRYNPSLCCEPPLEERSAGNLHATICGSRRRVIAYGDPVRGVTASGDSVGGVARLPLQAPQINHLICDSPARDPGTFILTMQSAVEGPCGFNPITLPLKVGYSFDKRKSPRVLHGKPNSAAWAFDPGGRG
jgi:hypothetical protein